MDRVILKRAQLKKMVEADKDYVVLATNTDQEMIYVEPLRYEGQGKGLWLKSNGHPRDEGTKL
jgi:hypothetical protein